jgi:hypothetical protein
VPHASSVGSISSPRRGWPSIPGAGSSDGIISMSQPYSGR